MRRYIQTMFMAGILVALMLFTAVCVTVYSVSERRSTQSHLRTVVLTAQRIPMADGDYQEWVNRIAEGDESLRVSLFDLEGYVLADTSPLVEPAEKHLDRNELIEALNGDWGIEVRRSETTGVSTFYVAHRLNDDLLLRVAYPFASIYTLLFTLLGIGVALLILIYFVVFFVSRRMTERLTKPLRQIDALLNGEDDGALRAREEKFPEVVPVLNNISARIQKLNSDMVEIQRTQRIRSDFVENASHELKSPLTSIKGFAELLDAGMVQEEARRADYLHRIVSETDRLLAIIEDILHLSMAERGPAEDVEEVDLKQIAEEIVKSLEPQAVRRGIHIEVAGGARLRANPQEIWELVYNLVDNGIRYGKEGGFIKIRIDEKTMTILDNGVGIPADQLPRIFERFYRVDKAHSRSEVGGTGLGLSIVRHIAQKYGGDVYVESTVGMGTMFTIRLW